APGHRPGALARRARQLPLSQLDRRLRPPRPRDEAPSGEARGGAVDAAHHDVRLQQALLRAPRRVLRPALPAARGDPGAVGRRLPGDPLPGPHLRLDPSQRRHERLRAGDDPRRRPGAPVRVLRPGRHPHPLHGHARRDRRAPRPPGDPRRAAPLRRLQREQLQPLRGRARGPHPRRLPARRDRLRAGPAPPGDRGQLARRPRGGARPARLGLQARVRSRAHVRRVSPAGHPAPVRGILSAAASDDERGDRAMYVQAVRQRVAAELDEIRAAGLGKAERRLESPQRAAIAVNGRTVLNFCANNYLGLADDPGLVAAAQEGLQRWGVGLSSVRFICGTQTIHTELEAAISRFLGTEDTILYTSCFDANGGLFETLLDERDAVISDALNHASIIDGIRLSKAARHRYAPADLGELAERLEETRGARTRLIATDGVFSMDGDVAPLRGICDLAERHDALVMVDDSHATGFFGPTGRGTPEHCGVADRVDIVTSTLGKALGGASGGFTT